ncbi:MAG: hypothetical protein V7K25_03445 [Nostoc sp.]|uniref:hypothetical protein n=1 Tax=Nostoc sp. TaxID=1180 RepID=UPI002FF72963
MFAYYEWGVGKVVKDGFNHRWHNLTRCITNSVFLPSDACGGLRLRVSCRLLMFFCIHTNIFCHSHRLRSPLVTLMSCIVMMALVTPQSQTTKGH